MLLLINFLYLLHLLNIISTATANDDAYGLLLRKSLVDQVKKDRTNDLQRIKDYFVRNRNKSGVFIQREVIIKSPCSNKFLQAKPTGVVMADLRRMPSSKTRSALFEVNRLNNYVNVYSRITDTYVCFNDKGNLKLMNSSLFNENCLFEIKCRSLYEHHCELLGIGRDSENGSVQFDRVGNALNYQESSRTNNTMLESGSSSKQRCVGVKRTGLLIHTNADDNIKLIEQTIRNYLG